MWKKTATWFILYPVIAHLGVQTSNLGLPVSYLLVLVTWFVLLSKSKSLINKTIHCVLIACVASLIFVFDLTYLFLQLLPIGILLTLAYTFAKSLTYGNIPVITRIATYVDNVPLNVKKSTYTRTVTRLWLGVFIVMLCLNIGTFLWLSAQAWSWIANVGGTLIVALVMLGEFTYRSRRFKEDEHNFKAFIIRLAGYKYKD